MGSIKDIVDLITKLRNSIQDRKIVSELLQIQSYIDSLHSECLHAKERALEYKTDNAQLKEDMIEIKRQVRRLKDSHAQEILDMRMIHGAEMAGADDAHDYDLILLESSAKTHDARKGSKQIQIKVTQGKSVAMYGEPEHLLVLRLLKNGTTEEIYNGPGKPAWDNAGKPQRNGQSSISLSRLRVLMKTVPDSQKVKKE
jgi:hypothetical protein